MPQGSSAVRPTNGLYLFFFTPGWVISPSQRPLPDNTQHSQQTNIHALSGIRTHDLSRRAAVDRRLRPHGHWDRLLKIDTYLKCKKKLCSIWMDQQWLRMMLQRLSYQWHCSSKTMNYIQGHKQTRNRGCKCCLMSKYCWIIAPTHPK